MRRVVLAFAAAAALAPSSVACSSGEPEQAEGRPEVEGEPAWVPDPPPRYKRVEIEPDVTTPDDEGEPTLQIKCSGHQPYVCPLDDGTFRCSDLPCVPDCDRVGCLGGEICAPCDGGFRCVAPGDGC